MRCPVLLLVAAAILAGTAAAADKATGDLKYKAGDYNGALKEYEEALTALGAGATSDAAADLWLASAGALLMQSDLTRARRNGEQALAMYTQLHGTEHRSVATALNEIGLAVQGAGDYGEAASYFNRALRLARALGEDGLAIVVLERLAFNCAREGDQVQAKLL